MDVAKFSAIPGLDSVVGGVLSVMQAQTAALAALPGAVESLSAAVKNLAEATAGARDTVQTMNRLANRIESIVEELEEPLKALAPGMKRMAAVIDDPIISEVPEVLTQLQKDMLPVLRTIADTHKQVASIAGSTERLMTFVDETGRTIAGIPGAALLGRRRPPAKRPSDLLPDS
jgi:ABC-type transporter Mla subunit MlaD